MHRVAKIAEHVTTSAQQPSLSGCPTAAASPIVAKLKAKIASMIPERVALKKELLTKYGETKIQDVTVEMAINGARSMKTMVTETSDLDAVTGIAYRGMSLYDTNKALPKAAGGEAGLPEAAFWLLLTGDVPSAEDTAALTAELHTRSGIPDN